MIETQLAGFIKRVFLLVGINDVNRDAIFELKAILDKCDDLMLL